MAVEEKFMENQGNEEAGKLLENVNEAKKQSEEPHPDAGWSETIRNRIAELTAPLTEHFQTFQEEKAEEKVEQTAAATPLTTEKQASNNAQAPEDGILQRIADLASPLTDNSEGYTQEDVPESAFKENLLQKVKSLFNKQTNNEIRDPTWKQVTDKISTLLTPLTDSIEIPDSLNGIDMNNLTNNQTRTGIAVFILLILFILRRRRLVKREQPPARRTRTASHDRPRARTRSGSFDGLLRRANIKREHSGTTEDVLDDGQNKIDDTPLVFGGPAISSITYETWSPPMQWAEASRMLVPVTSHPGQERKVTLNFQDGTLTREELRGKTNTFAMTELSLHIRSPTTGGVLEIYVKGAPKEEWMEHTFKSAHQAAQFQQDLINYQVVGESIQNMYESLELIQKGSMAHDGKECVLHDDTSDTKKGAVAWDDCMRCFLGMKPLRKALEGDLVQRIINDNTEGEETSLAEDYVNKRLLLGRFDFFRLFVPFVDKLALPQQESSPARVTELLERRKLVAAASVAVNAFVAARTVANKGWNLHMDLPEDTFTKRLAYDEDIDNVQRDTTAKNEYYEATVSRDVRCEVHSTRHLEKSGSSVMSQYQAFSLVGSQVFKLPPPDERHALSHRRDPVLSLPSLRKMVEANPELDFFVCAFFPTGLGVAIVHVFVRSLPRGVDAAFDTIMNRFMNGTMEVRQRKLEVFLQLGPGARLSPLAWASIKAVSLLLSWTRRGEAQIPFKCGADRTPFPGMTLSNYMETAHFGGSLQTKSGLPSNYAAVTTFVDPTKMNSVMHVLYQRLEEGALPSSTVDFTFVLEGEQADELPERALGTIRIVHLDALKVALPTSFSASQGPTEDEESVPEEPPVSALSPLTPLINSFMKTTRNLADTFMSTTNATDVPESAPALQAPQSHFANGATNNNDPFQAGVDALRDILRGVTVPVRRVNVSSADSLIAENGDETQDEGSAGTGDLVNVPVLSRKSVDDLRRYFRATGCDLKEAAVRVVESAAWRGITFPIDTKKCRIELQSGQFFQQGNDVDGDPVFYFQNMLMGPWRGNVDSSVAALLHRLESSLNKLSGENPDVKCTVIALVGKPFKRIAKKKKKRTDGGADESSSAAESKNAVEDGEHSTATSVAAHTIDQSAWNPFRMGANPRVYPTEDFCVHSNLVMFQHLSDVLAAHYPERLKRLILVPGQGRNVAYLNTTFNMRTLITSSRTRAKVIHLNRASELPKYVEDNELATLTGGWVEVEPEAFEC